MASRFLEYRLPNEVMGKIANHSDLVDLKNLALTRKCMPFRVRKMLQNAHLHVCDDGADEQAQGLPNTTLLLKLIMRDNTIAERVRWLSNHHEHRNSMV